MIIVLIHWRIRPDAAGKHERDFLDFWGQTATIENRNGFIGEYLSKVVNPTKDAPLYWLTWHLDPESLGDAIHYVNVGMWESEDRFYAEIADKFNDQAPMKDFELYRRRRLLLRPELHRVGPMPLPTEDSPGVK